MRSSPLAIRISDADRHAAERRLRDACAEGRLTIDELTQRLDGAFAARTAADLEPLLADLPAGRQRSTYAPYMERAVALVVDEFVLVAGSAVAGYLLDSAIVFAALLPLAHVAYYTALHGGKRGQTVGNRFTSTAVRSSDGGRLTYAQALGRTLVKLAGLAFWFMGGFVDVLWPLWDRRRQALHDKVADSVVVNR